MCETETENKKSEIVEVLDKFSICEDSIVYRIEYCASESIHSTII